jgi:hypothetical protein
MATKAETPIRTINCSTGNPEGMFRGAERIVGLERGVDRGKPPMVFLNASCRQSAGVTLSA